MEVLARKNAQRDMGDRKLLGWEAGRAGTLEGHQQELEE